MTTFCETTLPCTCSLAKICWDICKSFFVPLLHLHSAAIYSAQELVYLKEREPVGGIPFRVEGIFKMLCIFSPAVNESIVCNCWIL